MANKDDSFLSKHGDKINAAGHAINTLQNAKIAERQRKIAQLQAATAALQQEENELKKKELELLEKQQKALEEEKRKARQEKKQKEELKAELLEIAPQLKRMLENIGESGKKGSVATGLKLYEASAAITYLEQNKKVTDDINFHEYLFAMKDKLSECMAKYREEFKHCMSILEEFEALVEDEAGHFNAILTVVKEPKIDEEFISRYGELKKIMEGLLKEKELRDSLIDKLNVYKEYFLATANSFDSKFVIIPLNNEDHHLIYEFIQMLYNNKSRAWEKVEEIEKRIQDRAYTNNQISMAEKIINYLVSRSSVKNGLTKFENVSLSELKKMLKEIDSDKLPDDLKSRLEGRIEGYKNVVLNTLNESEGISENNVVSWRNKVDKMTGVQLEEPIDIKKELETISKKIAALNYSAVGAVLIGVGFITSLILFFISFDYTNNISLALLTGLSVLVIFLALGMNKFNNEKKLKSKKIDLIRKINSLYISEVKKAIKLLEN